MRGGINGRFGFWAAAMDGGSFLIDREVLLQLVLDGIHSGIWMASCGYCGWI